MSRIPAQALCLTLLTLTLFAILASPLTALADGIIIVEPPFCDEGPCPSPPPCEPLTGCFPWPCPIDASCWPPVGDVLEIKYHHVTVTIEDQIATTKIDQLFYNPNGFEAEGMYIFPIPRGASVSDFAMWVGEQKVEAKILDAEEAKQIYTQIVTERRDPALLEYIGQGAVQASVFPIPPGGERRVQIEYSQVLTAENGLIRYVYPLNTEKFSARPLDEVSISVQVKSDDAVRAIYSPTHKIAVDRDGNFGFTAGYEETDVTPQTDFELFYSVSPDDIGLNLLTYRDPADGDGFFVLLAAPGISDNTEVIAKDVIVVLDQSGSMEGSKFAQAQSALIYVLDHLNEDDRFNIISFSTGTQHYESGLQPAENADDAADWVNNLIAEGGTNIELALLEAMDMADRERPTILIFLTDGLPTEGVVDSEQILNDVNEAAPSNVRLFSFGVGDDVDTILLDSLSDENHGASAYVRPGENIEEAVSGFYNKVQAPVLTDLNIDFGDINVSEMYPEPLPDLFAGSQLVVVGRYRDGGVGTITLEGLVNGDEQSFEYADQTFHESGGESFIPRLWATRKIGYLLNQIRLKGENEEWVKAVVNLSVRYGIVTPYTSYLITEDDVLSSDVREDVIAREFEALQAAPSVASGGGAVDAAVGQAALENADVVDGAVDDMAQILKNVGNRTFLNVDGVWTDTQFDPATMTTTPVQFASDDYFALASARPDLGPALALGQRVIVLTDGVAYEVVPEETDPLTLPATVEPTLTSPESTTTPTTPATPSPVNTPVPPANGGGFCATILMPLFLLGSVVMLRRKK